MKSWEIFNAARKTLKNGVITIYGNRSARLTDYWAQDPALSADPKRNPIDRLFMLLHALDAAGKRDIAKSALRILADAIHCEIVDRAKVVPDKDTLFEEILDDMPCLIAHQRALQGTDLEEVDRTRDEIIRELNENRVRFIEERGLGDRHSRPPTYNKH